MINNTLTEKQLIHMVQTSKKGSIPFNYAYEVLVDKYIGLVKSIAAKFIKPGISYDELISYGLTGLTKAINEFDLNKDNKLSTYAYMWIFQTIQRQVAKDRDIAIPSQVCKLYSQVLILKDEGFSIKQIAKQLKVSQKKILQAISAFKGTISLESNIDIDNKPVSFASSVADDKLNPQQLVELEDWKYSVRKALKAALSQQEYDVINMFYGFNGPKQQARQIANMLKLSLARIKQIVCQAKYKLKHNKQLIGLRYQ